MVRITVLQPNQHSILLNSRRSGPESSPREQQPHPLLSPFRTIVCVLLRGSRKPTCKSSSLSSESKISLNQGGVYVPGHGKDHCAHCDPGHHRRSILAAPLWQVKEQTLKF